MDAQVDESKTVEGAVKRMETTKPTPTQEENDKHAMGETVEKHEEDGSPEQIIHPEAQSAEKQKEARTKSAVEQEKFKPTLTQEENDKHAMGEVVETHEADGSPEQDAGAVDKKERDAKAKPGGGAHYETRAARARRAAEEKPAE
jgi:hypothetical protein